MNFVIFSTEYFKSDSKELKYSKMNDTELDSRSPNNTKTNSGATIVWQRLNVYAKDKRNKSHVKRIICNANGSIPAGTLMAVMGSRFGLFLFHRFKIQMNVVQNVYE